MGPPLTIVLSLPLYLSISLSLTRAFPHSIVAMNFSGSSSCGSTQARQKAGLCCITHALLPHFGQEVYIGPDQKDQKVVTSQAGRVMAQESLVFIE